ncbi:MAG: hypothetical protein JRI68_13350 [Deltaproteobacteria bacterium]|nr:hypothetical protein [Deltaproteobacteria bacterium]
MTMSNNEPTAAEHRPTTATLGPLSRGRRALLGTLVALVGVTGALLTTGLGAWRRRRGPRERDLSEAHFYGPHDWAG